MNLLSVVPSLTTASELVVTLSAAAAPSAWTHLTHVMASVSPATSGCGATGVTGRVTSVSLSGATATFTLVEESNMHAFFSDLSVTVFSGADTAQVLDEKILKTNPDASRVVKDLANLHERRRRRRMTETFEGDYRNVSDWTGELRRAMPSRCTN
jgi:hypothetical protein